MSVALVNENSPVVVVVGMLVVCSLKCSGMVVVVVGSGVLVGKRGVVELVPMIIWAATLAAAPACSGSLRSTLPSIAYNCHIQIIDRESGSY